MGETNSNDLTPSQLKVGGKYNWRYQRDKLIYIGKRGSWHQFKRIGDPRPVWCEVLAGDIPMLEETKECG